MSDEIYERITEKLREAHKIHSDSVEAKMSYKKDDGKPRMDLILAGMTRTIEGVSEVGTMGATKYDEGIEDVDKQNWKNGGMRWGRVLAASMRHLFAWMRGEDIDPESGKHHLLHSIWGLMVLHESVYRFPHLDDRDIRQKRTVRVGLDIDETILDMCGVISKRIDQPIVHYSWPEAAINELQDCFAEDVDWPSIEPGEDLPFEPVAYITARRDNPNSREATLKWLDRNNFPYAPLVMGCGTGFAKVMACKEHKVDLFVDDKFENYQALNAAGITCLLFDRPHNQKYDVGVKRIRSLKEIENWL